MYHASLLIIIMILVICIGATLDSSSKTILLGTPGMVREGMSTLRPQTTTLKEDAIRTTSLLTHLPEAAKLLLYSNTGPTSTNDDMQKTHLGG